MEATAVVVPPESFNWLETLRYVVVAPVVVREVMVPRVLKRSVLVLLVVVLLIEEALVPFNVVMVARVLKKSVLVALVEVAFVLKRFWSVEEASTMTPVPVTFGCIHVELVAQRESPPDAVGAPQPKSPADHWRKLLPVQLLRFAPWSRVVEAFVAKSEVVVALESVASVATRAFVLKLVVVAEVPVALPKVSVFPMYALVEVAAVNAPYVPTIEVLKRLLEVALVVLPFTAIRLLVKKFVVVPFVEEANVAMNWVAKRLVPVPAVVVREVMVPLVEKRSVEVLLVLVLFVLLRSAMVEEASAMRPCDTWSEPCTSSVASDDVAAPPMRTWLVVVPSLIPEPLNHVQLISLEPAEPASVPQKKFPDASLFTSHPGAPTVATRSPPLRMVRPLVV
jgi:hypothetical protein